MTDIAPAVAGLEGGYVPVPYTSKTKAVIDFLLLLFLLMQIWNIYSVENIKCVHC